MARQEQIGMLVTLGVVAAAVILSYSSYLAQDRFLVELLTDVAIATSVAFSVWYLTTRKERRNRIFVRTRIVESYLEIISICEGLANNSERRTRVGEYVSDVNDRCENITDYAATYSHLLDPDEVETIFDEDVLIRRFASMLNVHQNDYPTIIHSINQLYTIVLDIRSRYIRIHNLTEFKEHECGEI